MRRLYVYQSPAADFYICRIGRHYLAYYDSQFIDSFATPEEAAEACATDPNITLLSGITFSDLRVPADLAGWKAID